MKICVLSDMDTLMIKQNLIIAKWCLGYNDSRMLVNAARNDNVDILNLVAETGFNVCYNDNLLLKYAARCGSKNFVETLIIKYGANPNDKIAIKNAIDFAYCDVLEILYKYGGVFEKKNINLIIAMNNGKNDLLKFFLEKKIYNNLNKLLFEVVEEDHNGYIEILLNYGANIHYKNDVVLRNAAYYGYEECIKILIKNGANVYANNCQALLWAELKNHTNVIKILTDYMELVN